MKTRIILITVTILVLAVGLSEAGLLDTAEQFIKTHPARAGVFYDFKNQEAHEYIAATIAENVFIPKLDISGAWDFDKALIGQIDYTIKEAALSPYAGIGAGLSRIENEHNMGEFLFEAHVGLKF